jgi:hypothetical protein
MAGLVDASGATAMAGLVDASGATAMAGSGSMIRRVNSTGSSISHSSLSAGNRTVMCGRTNGAGGSGGRSGSGTTGGGGETGGGGTG